MAEVLFILGISEFREVHSYRRYSCYLSFASTLMLLFLYLGTAQVEKVLTYTPDLSSASKIQAGQSKEARLDPDKFFTVETSVRHSETADLVEEEEEDGLMGEEQQRLTIAQAFASGLS